MHGCIKEDLSKISSDYDWNGKVSLPISSLYYDAGYFGGSADLIDTYNLMGNNLFWIEKVDFDFSDIYQESQYVDSIMLQFQVVNNFPGKVTIYAKIYDSTANEIDAVENSPLVIDAATIDEEGNVVGLEESQLSKKWFFQKDVPILETANEIILRIRINELDLTPKVISKIDSYNLDVKIGLRSVVTVPLDEIYGYK